MWTLLLCGYAGAFALLSGETWLQNEATWKDDVCLGAIQSLVVIGMFLFFETFRVIARRLSHDTYDSIAIVKEERVKESVETAWEVQWFACRIHLFGLVFITLMFVTSFDSGGVLYAFSSGVVLAGLAMDATRTQRAILDKVIAVVLCVWVLSVSMYELWLILNSSPGISVVTCALAVSAGILSVVLSRCDGFVLLATNCQIAVLYTAALMLVLLHDSTTVMNVSGEWVRWKVLYLLTGHSIVKLVVILTLMYELDAGRYYMLPLTLVAVGGVKQCLEHIILGTDLDRPALHYGLLPVCVVLQVLHAKSGVICMNLSNAVI